MKWLMFTPVEQHFYRRQHEECAGTAMKVSINFLKAIDKTYSVDWSRLEQTGSTPETLFLTFYYYSKIQEFF